MAMTPPLLPPSLLRTLTRTSRLWAVRHRNRPSAVARGVSTTWNHNGDDQSTYEWDTLFEEAQSMVQASFVSYPLTFLLREARRGSLESSDQILEKLRAIGDGDLSTYIIPDDILDIVRNNHEYIRDAYGGDFDIEFGWLSSFEDFSRKARQGGDPESISMLEFDDEGEHSRLVYGIALNKYKKRISVILRGTYSEGTRDWRRNVQFDPYPVAFPQQLLDISKYSIKLKSEYMHIHRGFYEYMFHNEERGTNHTLERYEEIKGNILGVLKDHPDYKLFITGHSLGGSLAQLAAFHAALHDSPLIPKPITCVSIGSPCVGDQSFLEAFRLLEELGSIRYLRITNSNDPITFLPPFSWYRHVGMNLRLEKTEGFKIVYPKRVDDGRRDRYESWRALVSMFSNPTSAREAVRAHYLPEYLRRLSREKASLTGGEQCPLFLNECYQDERIVGDRCDR